MEARESDMDRRRKLKIERWGEWKGCNWREGEVGDYGNEQIRKPRKAEETRKTRYANQIRRASGR